MRYFPLVKDNRDDAFAWLSEDLPDELRDNSWQFKMGVSVKDWFPENIIFDLSINHGIQLTDSIPSVHKLLVVSQKFKDVLADTGEDIEFFPVQIRNHKKRIVNQPYFVANLLDSLECVDRDKSDFEINSIRKDQILYFKKLVLNESLIPEGKSIFRLGEQKEQIIVNEELALHIIQEHNCDGIIFRAIENFGAEFRD